MPRFNIVVWGAGREHEWERFAPNAEAARVAAHAELDKLYTDGFVMRVKLISPSGCYCHALVDRTCGVCSGAPETTYTPPTLGTQWVLRGQGSTWKALGNAFLCWPTIKLEQSFKSAPSAKLAARTNLLLTGAPLTEFDLERWFSGLVV
jgi:hypothetical protein